MGCTRESIVEAVVKRFPSTLSAESLNKVKAIAMDLASKAVVETPMVHKPSAVLNRLTGKSSVTTVSETGQQGFKEAFKKARPSAAKWVAKEEAKYNIATQSIADGVKNSTASFVKNFYGNKANTGVYTKDDVVYLSANGNRTDRVIPVKNGVLQGVYKNIDKAIEAGAKFVADTSKHLASTGKYNIGELELATYLGSKGYIREDKAGYGLWSPKGTLTGNTAGTIQLVKLANGAVVNKADKNSSKIKVNSIEELAELSVQLDHLMSGNKDVATTKHWVNRFKELGIQTTFKPITVNLVNGLVKGKDLGRAYGNDSIHINTDYSLYKTEKDKYGESKPLPLRIILHEYVHTITQNALADKNNETVKKMIKLYNRVKGHASLKGERGIVDVAEFVAEAIANDRFKEKLDRIAGENKIVNKVKELFKELLKGLMGTKTEAVTALDEVLDLAHTLIQENNKYDNKGIRSKYAQEELSKGTKLYHVSDTKFENLAANGDVVVDKKGNKWIFNPIGTHVGTLDTVANYNSQMNGNLSHMYEIEPIEDIKTLRMKDPGDRDWTADNMYEQLEEKFGKLPFSKDADNSEVVKYLKDKGYDAIVYENTEESGESHIIINPSKFKVAYKQNSGTIQPKESTASRLVEAAKGCAK
jgi:hypothetical protein